MPSAIRFSSALLYLALLVTLSLTSAFPTHRLHRRGLPGAVYTCDEPNFRGNCQWTDPSGSAQCHLGGASISANKTTESIGPDPGGFCVLYQDAVCSGNQVQTLRFPGIGSNLPKFASFKCFMDGPVQNAGGSGIVQNGGSVGSGIAADVSGTGAGFLKGDRADPRLAGGVGSLSRKKMEDIMESFDVSQGMIGLRKMEYY